MNQLRLRGTTALFNALSRRGLFNCAAQFSLSHDLIIYAPLFTDNLWDNATLQTYEQAFFDVLAREAHVLPSPVTFIDCGASFGLFSLRMAQRCRNLSKIIAFEPNARMFEILARNLSGLAIPTEARPCGVGETKGVGELRHPAYDASPDACYFELVAGGSIEMAVVDDVQLDEGGSVILKIDVEGGELGVLRGAMNLLRRAREFVVTLEAHPKVVERTGIDPMAGVRLLNTVRRCSAYPGEQPELALHPDIAFFDQTAERRVFNIICKTTS